MRIGVPKERKQGENRVALTPAGAHALVQAGHTVTVETEAGLSSGFSDAEYNRAGAKIGDGESCWHSELVVKVKEPIESEIPFFRKGLLLFSYLHLAATRSLTDALVSQGVTALAYETLQLPDGSLPLLIPMSEVAGRVAVQAGAHFLENAQGGSGILLGGVPGVPPGRVIIVGGGTVGTQAARIASGMGAEVLLFDQNSVRLRFLDDLFGGRIRTAVVTPYYLQEELQRADLVEVKDLRRRPHVGSEQRNDFREEKEAARIIRVILARRTIKVGPVEELVLFDKENANFPVGPTFPDAGALQAGTQRGVEDEIGGP